MQQRLDVGNRASAADTAFFFAFYLLLYPGAHPEIFKEGGLNFSKGKGLAHVPCARHFVI